MSYHNLIREKRPRMSKSFAKLADFLLDHYVRASFMTATELAHELNLDAATVVRFAQNLGYKGYPELLRDIRSHVKRDIIIRQSDAAKPDSMERVINKSIQELAFALEHTRITLDPNVFSRLVDSIGNADRIFILAEGPAQHPAYNLTQFIEQGNFPVINARAGVNGFARSVHNSKPGDLILAIDIADDAPFIAPALQEAKQKGVETAAICGSAALPSGRIADLVLAARTSGSPGIGTAVIDSIIYTLIQVLIWACEERFEGTELEISTLSKRLQGYEA